MHSDQFTQCSQEGSQEGVPSLDGLGPVGAGFLSDVVRSVPSDHFRPADSPLLRAYCKANERMSALEHLIAEQGLVFDGEVNPYAKALREEAKLMMSLAVKLRLCPSSRMRADNAALTVVRSSAPPWQVDDVNE